MSISQFRALQHYLEQGDHDAVDGCVSALMDSDLSETQQALVLQLHGQHERSLAMRFSPQLALRELERCLFPSPLLEPCNQWLLLMQQLVRHGYGPALLRLLVNVATRYPLHQQRHDLIQAINNADGLDLAHHPELRPLWSRQQRLLTMGGMET